MLIYGFAGFPPYPLHQMVLFNFIRSVIYFLCLYLPFYYIFVVLPALDIIFITCRPCIMSRDGHMASYCAASRLVKMATSIRMKKNSKYAKRSMWCLSARSRKYIRNKNGIQASEKSWGAVAQAVKAIEVMQGAWPNESKQMYVYRSIRKQPPSLRAKMYRG